MLRRGPCLAPLLSIVVWLAWTAPAVALADIAPSDAELTVSPSLSDAELNANAQAALRARAWPSAVAAYRELVRRTPASAKAHAGLGTALLGLGKPDDAIAALDRSIAIEDSAPARYNVGLAYTAKKDLARASMAFRAAVKLQPDYWQAWSQLVDLLARAQRDLDAFNVVKEARAKCSACAPRSDFTRSLRPLVLYHHERAVQLFAQGNLELAQSGEKVVLAIDPDFADAYYNLGKIAVARGEKATAEAAYRRAVALYRPEEAQLAADAKNNLALLLAGKGAGSEAVTLVREAIAARGERPAYLDTLGRACDAVKDVDCARDAYRKLLAGAGSSVPADVKAHAKDRLEQLEAKKP